MPYGRRNHDTRYNGSRRGSGGRRNTSSNSGVDRLLPEREYRLALALDLVDEAKRAMLRGGLPAVRELLRGER